MTSVQCVLRPEEEFVGCHSLAYINKPREGHEFDGPETNETRICSIFPSYQSSSFSWVAFCYSIGNNATGFIL